MEDYFVLSAFSLSVVTSILEIIKKDKRIPTDNIWFNGLRLLTFLCSIGLVIWMFIFWFS